MVNDFSRSIIIIIIIIVPDLLGLLGEARIVCVCVWFALGKADLASHQGSRVSTALARANYAVTLIPDTSLLEASMSNDVDVFKTTE